MDKGQEKRQEKGNMMVELAGMMVMLVATQGRREE
jgi:hypothetical protein